MESFATLIIVGTLLVGLIWIVVISRGLRDDKSYAQGDRRLRMVLAANAANSKPTSCKQLAAPPGGQMNQRHQAVPIFSLRRVKKIYRDSEGSVVALNDVTIDFFPEFTALVGPSGEGKTTSLNLVGGLDSPTSGQIFVFGIPLRFDESAAMRRYRGTIPAWVFQEMNLVSHQTALENAALGLLCRGVGRRKALRAAMENLELLGIGRLAKRYPSQLSRGQQQRVAIARAFTSDAKIILADEPTGSLDPATAEAVMAECRKLSQRTGKPVVLVTHNHSLARRYCDRILECAGNGIRDITEQHEGSEVGEHRQPATAFNNPDGINRPTVVALPLPQTR